MRQDPVASPQDGTPTKQASDKTRPRNRCGSLWARIHRQDNETPALNALKALRGAPISMGRGEIPVELCQQPSVLPLLLLINLQTMKGVNLCKKIEPLKTNSPRQYGAKRKLEIQPSPSIRSSWNKQKTVWFLK